MRKTRFIPLAFIAASVVAIAAACSDSQSSPLAPLASQGKSGSTTGPDSGKSTNPNTPTSNGPATTMSISPAVLSVPQGQYHGLLAVALDKDGIRVDKQPKWTSSDPSIVTVYDTGMVRGVKMGTATVTATLDGVSASATVTVIAPVTTGGNPNPEPAVSSFNLTVSVAGSAGLPDTTVSSPVAGAKIVLTRVMGTHYDTLTTSEVVATKTSDATGQAKFENLPGGGYTVQVTPPDGSHFQAGSTAFGPPTLSQLNARVMLLPKP